jgi:spermidine synthase
MSPTRTRFKNTGEAAKRRPPGTTAFNVYAAFLVISGVASLTYQVAWVRLLGLSMGSTSASVSTVLAAFFLGLALGSFFAERLTRHGIDRLRPYLVLEALIGIFGLLLLPVLLHLDTVMAWMPALGANLGTKFAVAMGLMCIPTVCMGATFPVMAALLVRNPREVGLRLGQLYSLNTFGAVMGAVLCGFVLIPAVGIDGGVYFAFTLNMVIVLTGAYLDHRIPLAAAAQPSRAAPRAAAWLAGFQGRALVVLFCTGLVAIATEVGWTKYLAIFTGTTLYGFAAILAVFLIGIAAGSWAIQSRLESIRQPALWMAAGLALLGAALLFTRGSLSVVPQLFSAINHVSAPDAVIHAIKYGFVFLILFVPTFLFGALFPLNLKMYCANLAGVRERVGRAYAVNTLASIMGSLLAGFWIIPAFGTDALLTAMALIVLALPFLFLPSLPAASRWIVGAFALAVVASNWALPHLDYRALIASVGYRYDNDVRAGKSPQFLFLKEGKAGVISVVTYDGKIAKVQNNGLNESLIDLHDPARGLLAEQLLGLMPYFLHEDPRSAFVVGYGGGVTTRALTYTTLKTIRVVELEPAVVEAGRALARGEPAVLCDPRVSLTFNDARNTLLLEPTTYDVIVSQPSHSWLAGAANVFTREFFEMSRSRLNDGGIHGQWVNLFNMDATTLRAIFKAFYSVFPEGITFANTVTGDYLLFGSEKPLRFDYERVNARLNRAEIKQALRSHNIYTAQDLLWYFALSRREIMQAVRDAPVNLDTNILSEVRLSALVAPASGDENPYGFLRKTFNFDLAPYVDPKMAAQRLHEAGLYFVRHDTWDVGEKIERQLKLLDPLRARALGYELYRTQLRYKEAFALYDAHPYWPDGVHRSHGYALAELGRMEAAERALARIQNENERRAAQARLWVLQGKWEALANLAPRSPEEHRWQLVGLAQRGVAGSGEQLQALSPDAEGDIPTLQALARYFAIRGNTGQTEKVARLMVNALNRNQERLARLAVMAIEQDDTARALWLVDKMAASHPEQETLPELRRRIADKINGRHQGGGPLG